MGLDTTHNAWHGAYSAFMRWRQELAKVAGLPPLDLMEGFYVPLQGSGLPTLYHGIQSRDGEHLTGIDSRLPIKWDCLKPSPLHELLYHSDCEGEIPADHCGPIADALEALLPQMPGGEGGGHIGNWRDKTKAFIDGLRAAAAAGEPLGFH